MPDINDINGVTVANLAKLDAVLKANISKVNGLTLSVGALLLDTYTGAAAAYSTRKLKTGVTVAARIRRSGDDIEADVEFDSNNEISLTSPISNASSGTYTDLADFVDHSTTPRDAFVDEWKDQSGSGNHATQSTLTSQPKLYDATTGLITENGKPIISRVSSSTGFSPISADMSGSTISMTSVAKISVGNSIMVWFGSSLTERLFTAQNGSSLTGGGQAGFNSTGGELFFNGSSQGIGATRGEVYTQFNNNQTLATWVGLTDLAATTVNLSQNSSFWQMYDMQEIIFWESDQATNRTGIETNINSEYLIYQPTDAPTSGLLATYTGAAAAYSVRQLSDKAVLAMRIRRDSDDEERNIGFDSNGDLDTTAISDFCGTANGYVTRWWDQSTNGIHADQATDTIQPQIYNGTAVITENGKPAIQWDGSDDYLETTSAIFSGTTARSIFITGRDRSSTASSFSGIISPDVNSTGNGENYTITSEIALRVTQFAEFSDDFLDANLLLLTNIWASGNATDADFYLNGTALTNTSGNSTVDLDTQTHNLLIGKTGYNSACTSLTASELVFWNSDQSSPTNNRPNIESDIMTYFSIT